MSNIEKFMKRQSMQSILALGGIVFVLTYFIVISVMKVPTENENYVNYSMGWLSGIGTMIFGYYFGSSKKQNDDQKTDIEQ